MNKDEVIEINEFTLRYDGIFIIKFNFNGVSHQCYVYVPPNKLIQLLQNEGIALPISDDDFMFEPINFRKSTILLNETWVKNDKTLTFLPDASAEHYQDMIGYSFLSFEIKQN